MQFLQPGQTVADNPAAWVLDQQVYQNMLNDNTSHRSHTQASQKFGIGQNDGPVPFGLLVIILGIPLFLCFYFIYGIMEHELRQK